MKRRNLAAVIFLPFLTFGIYALVWHVKTKGELNRRGASVPTAWLLIVPIGNFYWLWKYYKAGAQVTKGDIKAGRLFAIVLVPAVINILFQTAVTIALISHMIHYDSSPFESEGMWIVHVWSTAYALINLGAMVYLQVKYNRVP